MTPNTKQQPKETGANDYPYNEWGATDSEGIEDPKEMSEPVAADTTAPTA